MYPTEKPYIIFGLEDAQSAYCYQFKRQDGKQELDETNPRDLAIALETNALINKFRAINGTTTSKLNHK